MKKLKTAAKFFAALFFLIVLFSPLWQHLAPPEKMVKHDAIAGWSYGLAQITFALVAAFAVFFLPQVIEVDRFLLKWKNVRAYYASSPRISLRQLLSGIYQVAIEYEKTETGTLSPTFLSCGTLLKLGDETVEPDRSQLDKTLEIFSHQLKDVALSGDRWLLLLEKGGSQAQPGWSEKDARRLLLASYCCDELRKRVTLLIILLVLLMGISILL